MTQTFQDILQQSLTELQIEADRGKTEQLYQYYELVIEKNKVMNLTAITDEKEFVQKHLIDSLAIVKDEKLRKKLETEKLRVIDVGTGAGLPGIVLKIVFPKLQIVLFDSLKKRLKFLDEVIEKLQLKEISTLHGRAEDIGSDRQYRETYDLVVSRAVANLSTLAEYCLPLVRTGGLFVSYKGSEVEDEQRAAVHAINKLGGRIESVEKYMLPKTNMARSLVLVEKIKKTPAQYPRKAGVPSKNPIS